MELHAVELLFFVKHPGDRAGGRGAHHLEAFRKSSNFVAVAHPDFEHAVTFRRIEVFNSFEQTAVAMSAHFSVTKFTLSTAFDFATQLLSHGLHPIADPQHWHASVEDGRARLVVAFFVGAHMRARENDAFRGEFFDEFCRHIIRMNFAINMRFSNTTSDELSHLAAEVKNKNTIVRHE